MKADARLIAAMALALLVVSLHGQQPQTPTAPGGDVQGFRFKSGVELVNVTATVSDASGRFVPDLKQEDFVVYEDDQVVDVTHFSAERVPVSLGIAVDTSGSMAGQKIQEAQAALDRFLFELLDKEDQIFLYRFSNRPVLLQDWTRFAVESAYTPIWTPLPVLEVSVVPRLLWCRMAMRIVVKVLDEIRRPLTSDQMTSPWSAFTNEFPVTVTTEALGSW